MSCFRFSLKLSIRPDLLFFILADKHQTFTSLLTRSNLTFLKLFKLTVYDTSRSLVVHLVEGRLVKSCIMDKSKPSQLALPGSCVKRSREDEPTNEIELGVEKKRKADDCLKSNLTKTMSKSMMNIDGKNSKVEFQAANSKVKVPLPNTMENQRRQTTVFNGRTNVSHSR